MEKPILPGLRTLFLVHLIIGLIFGLAYLLIPETFAGLFGMSMKDPVYARLLGAAILGFTASSWWAYRETVWEKVKIVVQAEIVWTALGTLAALWGELIGGVAPAGWLNVIILAGLCLAFAYYYSKNSAVESVRPATAH